MNVRRLTYHLVGAIAGALLAACGPSTATPQPPAGPSVHQETTSQGNEYLYAAASTRPGSDFFLNRFVLRNGLPHQKPDRVYQNYGQLIALAGNGTLYAFGPGEAIYAFSPGSNAPTRELKVEPRCGGSSFTVFNAMAADDNGYIFLSIYSYPGLHARAPGLVDPNIRTPCNGIAVYAPDAHGKARPVNTIHVPTSGLDGLAVDVKDNLYVAGSYPSEVNEYANAVAKPRLTRTFKGQYVGDVRSVAVDAGGNVYIANAKQSYSTGWIDRYAPRDRGDGPPTSMISIRAPGPHVLYSIAVRGRYLYADDTGQDVEVYRAAKNGEQSPLRSIGASNVSSVTAGP